MHRAKESQVFKANLINSIALPALLEHSYIETEIAIPRFFMRSACSASLTFSWSPARKLDKSAPCENPMRPSYGPLTFK